MHPAVTQGMSPTTDGLRFDNVDTKSQLHEHSTTPKGNLGAEYGLKHVESSIKHGDIEWTADGNDLEERWTPSFMQFRPISGLVALAVAFSCMLASLAVLIASDGRPVSAWSIQPTVPLAILSAVGAGAIRYAKCSAAPIAWWYKAVQGTTIRRLEDHWQASRGLLTALTRFRHARWISTATLLTTLMIVDGAMLQRASSVWSSTTLQAVTLEIELSPELPTGFSGFVRSDNVVISQHGLDIIEDTLKNTAIMTTVSGCQLGATCTGQIQGPGVAIKHCHSQSWTITPEMLRDSQAKWGTFHETYVSSGSSAPGITFYTNPVFQISLTALSSSLPILQPADGNQSSTRRRGVDQPSSGTASSSNPEGVRVVSGFASIPHIGSPESSNVSGEYILSECVLHPAILEYEVTSNDGVLSPSMTDARFIAWANNTSQFSPSDDGSHGATIDGFTAAMDITYNANATASFGTPAPSGETWALDASTLNAVAGKYFNWRASLHAYNFSDPLPDIMSSMNELMFRGGLMAASWPNVTNLIDATLSPRQAIIGTEQFKENVYHTDFRWFAGAAVLDVLVIVVVLPLFWAWWTLPRNLSMSPFEMALAFDSPLVQTINSASGSNKIVSQLGDTRVAYGLVGKGPNTKSDETESTTPLSHPDLVAERLGIAEAINVTRPGRGATVAL